MAPEQDRNSRSSVTSISGHRILPERRTIVPASTREGIETFEPGAESSRRAL